MAPKSYEVTLPKIEKHENPTLEVSVIGFPQAIDNKLKVVSYEEALREIGFGKVQLQLVLIVALILAQVINETMGISYIVPAAQCDLNLSTSDKGLLTGMSFFGIMAASYFGGFLGDTQGRKRTVLASLIMSTIFSLISVFLKSFTLYVVFRFLTGVCVAGYAATIYAYVGEFNSDKNRASIIVWVSASVGLASTILPLLAMWILSYDFRFELYNGYLFRPWRLLCIIYAIPGIAGGLWLVKFPESPKFLLAANRDEEALEIVCWIYRTNKGKSNHDDFKIGKLISEASEASLRNDKGLKAVLMSLVNQTLPLFKPPYVLYFMACSFLHFGTYSIAGGMASFLPDTLNRLSKARTVESGDLRVCDIYQNFQEETIGSNETEFVNQVCDDSVDSGVYFDSAIVGAAIFVAFVILSLTIDKLGRRIVFIVTLFVSGASGIILTFMSSRALIIVFYGLFIVMTGLNVSLINGAAVEIFPTHLRAMAICVSMLFGRLGTAVSTNIIGATLEMNCSLTYYMFSAMVLVCLAVSFLLPG